MSAIDFLRTSYPATKAPDPGTATSAPPGSPIATEEEVWTHAPAFITPAMLAREHGILHLTVRRREDRRRSNTHTCHLWQSEFPPGAFYRLTDDAYIATPEFAFLQLAQALPLPELIALGYELCGLYTLDARSEFGMRQRTAPLMTLESLVTFLNHAERSAQAQAAQAAATARAAARAAADDDPDRAQIPAPDSTTKARIIKARRAAAYIIENSASPRETALAMRLTLPIRLGGYALPRPIMNHEIVLTPEAAHIAHRRTLRADLFWPQQRLDLEFNGQAAHSGARAEFSDRARTNALELMGYTVREITRYQLDDFAAFESLALHLAALLGKRIRPNQRGPLPARQHLHHLP